MITSSHSFGMTHQTLRSWVWLRQTTVNVGEYLRKSAKSRKKGKVLATMKIRIIMYYCPTTSHTQNLLRTEPFVCHLSTPFYTGPSPTSSSQGTKVCYHSVMHHYVIFEYNVLHQSLSPRVSIRMVSSLVPRPFVKYKRTR